MAAGVLIEISVSERLERLDRRKLPCATLCRNGVATTGHQLTHGARPITSVSERNVWIVADGRTRGLAGSRIAEAEAPRPGTLGGDPKREAGCPDIGHLNPAGRWRRQVPNQHVCQVLAHGMRPIETPCALESLGDATGTQNVPTAPEGRRTQAMKNV